MTEKVKVWLSKYALTTNIQECEAKVEHGKAYPGHPFMSFVGFTIGKEAHLSRPHRRHGERTPVVGVLTPCRLGSAGSFACAHHQYRYGITEDACPGRRRRNRSGGALSRGARQRAGGLRRGPYRFPTGHGQYNVLP